MKTNPICDNLRLHRNQKSQVVALKSLVVKQRRNKELSILKMLRHHPNVVDLLYFYFSGQDEDLQLNLFFERVDSVTSSALIFTSLAVAVSEVEGFFARLSTKFDWYPSDTS